MLLFTGLAWPSQVGANEIPSVVVDMDSASCSDELTEDFVRELELRTSAQLRSPYEAADDIAYHLTLTSADEFSCEVRLQNSSDTWALDVDRDANRPEIASVANRMAWILDGTHMPEPDTPVPDTAVEEALSGVEIEPADPPAAQKFSVDATGGAMWIPAADAAVPLARVQASWMPRSNLRLGLNGRLPMRALAVTRDGVTHTYRPWAVSLTAGYARQIGDRWSLGADAGIQRTIPHLAATSPVESTDDTQTESTQDPQDPNTDQQSGVAGNYAHITDDYREDENYESSGDVRHDDEARDERPGVVTNNPDSSLPEALVSWAAVTHASLHYSVTPDLALRLDTGVAVSPGERYIQDEQGTIMNLGRLEFDMLLGLDLRF